MNQHFMYKLGMLTTIFKFHAYFYFNSWLSLFQFCKAFISSWNFPNFTSIVLMKTLHQCLLERKKLKEGTNCKKSPLLNRGGIHSHILKKKSQNNNRKNPLPNYSDVLIHEELGSKSWGFWRKSVLNMYDAVFCCWP